MINNNFTKSMLLVAIFSIAINVTACEQGGEILLDLLWKIYASEDRLIHISVSKPTGWRSGCRNTMQIQSDFSFYRAEEFAIFSHPSSHSRIFVSYKPILGVSYFSRDPQRVAEWFKEAHLTICKKYKAELQGWLILVGDSVDSYRREIGGKTFYVIKNEIFNHVLKENRTVYIFLHISEDVTSLYMFCFSTLAKQGLEEEKPFQDFLAMVKGFRTIQLEPYDEALYRNSLKLWMANHEYHLYMDAKWYNAIMNEAIEELKKAATLKSNGWEPHYLLIMEYSSSYFRGYPTVVVDGKPKVRTDVSPFSPEPINADAAIEELKFLTKLNPDFKQGSKWVLGSTPKPSLRAAYITIGRMLNGLKRYDEAIIHLQEGIKRVPTDLEGELQFAYRDRAKIRAKKGDYDGAIEDLKSSIAIHENRIDAVGDYQALAEMYVKKGKKKEALEALSKALEIVKKEKVAKEVEDKLGTRINELQTP